jgi:transposase InsO family protein
MNAYLKKIYYNPEHGASFGTVDKLFKAARKDNFHFDKKSIQTWLQNQPPHTLHKQNRVKYSRTKTIVSGLNDQFQADLLSVENMAKFNRKTRFILTCIDVLSKYAWAIPLTDKKGVSVYKALEKIFQERVCNKLQSDKGTEFKCHHVQKLLKKLNIKFFSTEGDTKAAIVERFNRSLRSRMFKYMTSKNTRKYIDVLPQIMNGYNRAYHRSIKTSPNLVTRDNEIEVWKRLYYPGIDETKQKKSRGFGTQPPLRIGDYVRISKTRSQFSKPSSFPTWSHEIFKISKIINNIPITYELFDLNYSDIKGRFYREELQKVIVHNSDNYDIERVISRRGKGKNRQLYVKWMHWPESFNSWINTKDLSH